MKEFHFTVHLSTKHWTVVAFNCCRPTIKNCVSIIIFFFGYFQSILVVVEIVVEVVVDLLLWLYISDRDLRNVTKLCVRWKDNWSLGWELCTFK